MEQKNTRDLQGALQKPVIPSPQMKKIMAQFIVANTEPIEPRWYVSFLRTTLVSFGLTIGGHAFGFVLIAIAHYTGLEAWMDAMRNY